MAKRRMFSTQITDSDNFVELPLSTQALYFHLGMAADDDGFVNNPKRLQRAIGANEDDLKLLIAKNFALAFDSGVVVIKHWKINNYIPKDRYKPTVYEEEKAQIFEKPNRAYTKCIQNVHNLGTQTRLDKTRLEKIVVSGTNDLMELLSPEDITYLYAMYEDAGLLISSVQEQLDRRKTEIKVSALQYIKGYATNKRWVKK